MLLRPWPWPDTPFKRVHIDCFVTFWGQKWIEVFPTKGSYSSSITISLLRPLFARIGLPEMIVADNGTAFPKAELKKNMEINGMRHLTTAPYPAASNGLPECTVQTVKRGHLEQTAADIDTRLSRFLFNYWATSIEVSGTSPAEMMLKRPLRTRFELLRVLIVLYFQFY